MEKEKRKNVVLKYDRPLLDILWRAARKTGWKGATTRRGNRNNVQRIFVYVLLYRTCMNILYVNLLACMAIM